MFSGDRTAVAGSTLPREEDVDESDDVISESVPAVLNDSNEGSRGEGGCPSVNGFEGLLPSETCGGKLNPVDSAKPFDARPVVRGDGFSNQFGDCPPCSSSADGEGLGNAGIDIRRPPCRSVAVLSPESPCRARDGRRSCSSPPEKLLRRSRIVMIDSLEPEEEGFDEVVDDMDPDRGGFGDKPGRIMDGIGALDERSPRDVDASDDRR
jgi:hypothetical protein